MDEPWYKTIFEIAAEFGCPILQNINTPVAPFTGVHIDRNVVVSNSVLDQFGSAVPASVIYPSIDLDRFAPPAVIDPDSSFDAIGMIYRLENDKLDKDAIELFLEIAKRRPKTRIVIIGDGSFARRAEGRLSQFEFTGYVPYEDLPAQFARFKTFIAPIRPESLGQVIPFAMCAGLAVATRSAPCRKSLGDTRTLGETLDEAVEIVTALLDDPKRIAALGERNRTLALERFSVEDMAVTYFQLYRNLATTGRANLKFVSRIYGANLRRVIDFVEYFSELGNYLDMPVNTYSSDGGPSRLRTLRGYRFRLLPRPTSLPPSATLDSVFQPPFRTLMTAGLP